MKKVILYTMKGCPHCDEMKKMLIDEKIKFTQRDINKYEKEYDLFVQATDSEFIPAFMMITLEKDNKTSNIQLMVPDEDFDDLDEALIKVKRYLN
jgi:glutaredoxin